MAALLNLFSLTSEQRRFLWRKQIVDTRTPAAWLELFRPMGPYESDPGKGGCLAAFLALGAAGLLCAGVVNLFSRHGLLSGVVLLLLGLGCGAGVGAMRLRLRGRRLERGLNPLLAALREDMAADDKVTLTVDMRGAERKANRIGRRDLGARGSYPEAVEITFADNWLQGDAVLADGTKLQWEITEYVRLEVRTKRNARGKSKSKTRRRMATHLRIDAGWRKDRFALTEAAGTAVRDDGRRFWLKLRRTFRHATGEAFNAGQFVQTVAAGYAQTKPTGGAA
jgi:hypothetical protein